MVSTQAPEVRATVAVAGLLLVPHELIVALLVLMSVLTVVAVIEPELGQPVEGVGQSQVSRPLSSSHIGVAPLENVTVFSHVVQTLLEELP
jgi:hypothetical protein